jgi:hypothetical protein
VSDRSVPVYQLPDILPTDPVLADLLPEFAEQWLHDLTVTWSSLHQAQDSEGLRRFGHTIKGSFLQFGFRDLSVIGSEIMRLAEMNDWEGAGKCVEGLLLVMHSLRARIRPAS